jgi:hypothetical protein
LIFPAVRARRAISVGSQGVSDVVADGVGVRVGGVVAGFVACGVTVCCGVAVRSGDGVGVGEWCGVWRAAGRLVGDGAGVGELAGCVAAAESLAVDEGGLTHT